MTPQPEQEYIITEKQIRKVEMHVESKAFWDSVRTSRPAPSPCVQCLEEDRVSMMEHDAATAAQAREDDTKRIVKILEDCRFGLDYPDCPPGDAIKKLVESIRSREVQE